MEAIRKKVESQVQFWSLLGPFFVLLSTTLLLFKVSPHWYFPVCALIGIPLCVRWKMKGMAIALGCLFLVAGLNFSALELDDRYWHVGLSLAMAFSFIVLTLSVEEAQGLVSKVQIESQSRLDNLLLVDEKWKAAELEWSREREMLQSKAVAATQENVKTLEDRQTFYKLAQLAKDELIQVRGQHEQLLQDLHYKKQQIAQLHERIEENELTIQEFVNSDVEKEKQRLSEQIAQLEREKETAVACIAVIKEEQEAYRFEKERLLQELHEAQNREAFNDQLALLEQEKGVAQARLAVIEGELNASQVEKEQLKEQLRELQENTELSDRLALLEQEKGAAQARLAVIEGELNASQLEKEGLVEQLRELQENTELSDRLTLLEQEKGAAQARIALIEGELNASQLEKERLIEQLRELQENTELSDRLTLLEREKGAAQARLAVIEDELNASQLEKERLIEQLRELQENTELSDRLTLLEQEKGAAQARIAVIEDELNASQLEKEHLIAELLETQENEKKCLLKQRESLEISEKQQQLFFEQQKNYTLLEDEKRSLVQACERLEQLHFKMVQEEKEQKLLLEEVQAKAASLELKLKESLEQQEVLKQHYSKMVESERGEASAQNSKRSSESMYAQLKEQFQEKSNVLDATRRELFGVHEELLKWRREFDETSVYDIPYTERQLQKQLIQMDRQFEQMKTHYRQEIDDLMQLVGHLFACQKSGD